jgi:hypothetical protein
MSTESIVNRVKHEPPSGYSEEQMLMPEGRPKTTLSKPAGAPTELVEDKILVQGTSPDDYDPPTEAFQFESPRIEPSTAVDDPSTIPGLFGTDLDKLNAEIAEIAAQYQKSSMAIKPDTVDLIEFQEFKRQVIATFKHLGVDVRKHFTE